MKWTNFQNLLLTSVAISYSSRPYAFGNYWICNFFRFPNSTPFLMSGKEEEDKD